MLVSHTNMNSIQVASDGGKQVKIPGTAMLIRVRGRDTGGSVAVVETHDLPGGGPPPHIHHREDETFQILEGEYEFTVGAKTISSAFRRVSGLIFIRSGNDGTRKRNHSYRAD